MPSSFTHAFVGGAIGKMYSEQISTRRIILVSIFLSVMPDFDVVGDWLGAAPESMFAHRGITHSLLFAAIVSAIVPRLVARRVEWFSPLWWRLYSCFIISISSHAILDMFNYGNLGVALFAPFDESMHPVPQG